MHSHTQTPKRPCGRRRLRAGGGVRPGESWGVPDAQERAVESS